MVNTSGKGEELKVKDYGESSHARVVAWARWCNNPFSLKGMTCCALLKFSGSKKT